MANQSIELNVDGMSCEHCENIVKKAVGALNGVEKVDVNLHDNIVSVDFNSDKVTLDAIKNTISSQGYDVE